MGLLFAFFKWILFFTLVGLDALAAQGVANETIPCALKYGNDSFVCVCNATYCDTLPRISNVSSQYLYTYTSGRDGGRFNLTMAPITANAAADPNILIITPQLSQVYQSILGFGGAFTDSAIYNIGNLPSEVQDKLLQSYFSPDELGYTMGRVPLACTDFSTRAYSYDDDQPGDYPLKKFSLAKEDVLGKIPMIKRAEKIAGRKLNLVAGAWSAPYWMKTDNKTLGGGIIRTQAYEAFARYHVLFLRAYAKSGVHFWGISNGNEPIDAVVSTAWSPQQMGLWISSYLGPHLSRSFPLVKLLLLDDLPQVLPNYLPIMQNRSSGRYISGWAVHPYTDVNNLAPNLQLAHSRSPHKLILQTEFSTGIQTDPPVLLGSWQRAQDYAIRIITGFNNWAIGWIDWNLALNTEGGPTFVENYIDSAIIVNGTEFYKQPSWYIQGHFSHFIPPGSHRVGMTIHEPNANVDATAALTPDDNVVVVILNSGTEDLRLVVRCGLSTQAILNLPAKSIVTAIYRRTDTPLGSRRWPPSYKLVWDRVTLLL